jgi:hypothetical protein
MPERGKEKEGNATALTNPISKSTIVMIEPRMRSRRLANGWLFFCSDFYFWHRGKNLFSFSQTPGEHWKLRLFIRVPAFLFFFINLNGSFANLN